MVASQRTLALFTCLLFLFSTIPAQAGTPNNPEVTDPSGDTYDTFIGMPDTSPGTEQVDITAAWFKEVGQDHYRITVEVADLTTPGQFRLARSAHEWVTEFSVDGHRLNSDVIRTSDGAYYGQMSVIGVQDLEGAPNTDDGTATVEFDADDNTISITMPRTWSVNTPNGSISFDFTDGTSLTNIIVRSYDGIGTNGECDFCVQLDDTDPVDSADFTFGEKNDNGGGNGNVDHGHGNDTDGCDESNPANPDAPGQKKHCGPLDPRVNKAVAGVRVCALVPPPESPGLC